MPQPEIIESKHMIHVGEFKCNWCGVELRTADGRWLRDTYCQDHWPLSIASLELYNALAVISSGCFGPDVAGYATEFIDRIKMDARDAHGHKVRVSHARVLAIEAQKTALRETDTPADNLNLRLSKKALLDRGWTEDQLKSID